jgi:hypothetical protein
MRQSCVTPILTHQPAATDEEIESLETAHSSVKLEQRFKCADEMPIPDVSGAYVGGALENQESKEFNYPILRLNPIWSTPSKQYTRSRIKP